MLIKYFQQLYFNLHTMHILFPTYQKRFGYLDGNKFKSNFSS